jgi:tRNA-dihydrouridine synthase B
LNIGTVKLENPVVLAPMAGVTDAPFRKITKRFGPGLLCAEMVSATALHFMNRKTRDLTGVDPAEKPLSIQIFGSEPDIMAGAARFVAACGASIIDINMGCPVPKVVKNGEGAAVKFRLGWDQEHIVAPELAKIAEGCGAAAVAVHGRTRNQFYHGHADWAEIGRVKAAVKIPVIGNGDIRSPETARALMEQTGCDGVMIGQAACGNPWIFRQVAAYLQDGRILPGPSVAERFQTIRDHLELQVAYSGETRAIKEMRKHLAWYFKGLPGSARFRDLINTLTGWAEVSHALTEYAASLRGVDFLPER